jgi:phosphoglycolate phosphatase-like HAD superfamily hydrolase
MSKKVEKGSKQDVQETISLQTVLEKLDKVISRLDERLNNIETVMLQIKNTIGYIAETISNISNIQIQSQSQQAERRTYKSRRETGKGGEGGRVTAVDLLARDGYKFLSEINVRGGAKARARIVEKLKKSGQAIIIEGRSDTLLIHKDYLENYLDILNKKGEEALDDKQRKLHNILLSNNLLEKTKGGYVLALETGHRDSQGSGEKRAEQAERKAPENGFIVVKGSMGELSRDQGVAVFDLDGVIFDSSERFRKALEEVGVSEEEFRKDQSKRSKVWDVFLSEKYMDLDRLNNAVLGGIRRALKHGLGIVILSGRPERMIRKTLEMLRKNGIDFDLAVFRAEGNYARDREFKVETLKKLGLRVEEIHDDVEDVITAIQELYPNVRGYLWRGGKIEKEISRKTIARTNTN